MHLINTGDLMNKMFLALLVDGYRCLPLEVSHAILEKSQVPPSIFYCGKHCEPPDSPPSENHPFQYESPPFVWSVLMQIDPGVDIESASTAAGGSANASRGSVTSAPPPSTSVCR